MMARTDVYSRILCRSLVALFMIVLVVAAYAGTSQTSIGYSLNYENTDIAVVLKSLSDISGANIVISPDVKGAITLRLKGVGLDEALQTIAQMTGNTYQKTNGVYMFRTTPPTGPVAEGLCDCEAAVVFRGGNHRGTERCLSRCTGKGLKNERLVLDGEAERVNDAKAFINEIDQPVEPETRQFEASYTVKALVPHQAKQYLEHLYRHQGLIVSFAPNQLWDKAHQQSGAPDTETPAAPAAEPGQRNTFIAGARESAGRRRAE